MPGNFTAADIVGSVEASLLLTLILLIPGYVVGWLSNVFDFRNRRLETQALLSTPLAVAVVPVLIFLLGRYPKVLWVLLGASWFVFALLLRQIWKRWRQIRKSRVPRAVSIGGAFALAWAFIAITTLVDLQFKDRLYFSATAYDYSTRTAFTAAAARAIPPVNPFFAGGPPVPLRYHYFWMLVCGLVTRLGNVSPRQALCGGTVWGGIALMSLIGISLKFFVRAREHLERKTLIGCGLLLVTGLDILPTAFLYLRWRQVNPDMEWWNEQITSWVDGLLWTPHHLISFVACLVGLLLIRQPVSTKYQRVLAILIAGLAFASAAGLSLLTSFTFAAFAALWLLFAALRKWWDDVTGLLGAGAIGLVAALPFLSTVMRHGADSSGGGGQYFAVAIRNFPLGMWLISWMFHTSPQQLFAPGLIRLLLLPLNYFLELGLFFVVGVLRIRSIRAGSTRMTREEETGWMMVAISFLIGSFLRSTTLDYNDLGWRCFLQAQFVLLLWAALFIDDWWSNRCVATGRRPAAAKFAVILAAIGVIGTIYQVSMLRAYPILVDKGTINPEMAGWLDQDHLLGQRTYALRSVYESLGNSLPPDAIVQYNPSATSFIPHQLYSGHDAAIGLPFCGAVFGGYVSQCVGRIRRVSPMFVRPSQAQSASLDITCNEFGINVMLVDDLDTVWGERDSWVWTRKPILANEHVRAFACGDPRLPARFVSGR